MKLLLALVVFSASSGAGPVRGQSAAPEAIAAHVDQAPTVDGRLGEALWQRAAVISRFLQKEPEEGIPATEVTRVRIVYDETALYVGVVALDVSPGQIRASELRRDNSLESDDSFAVILDTYHDHRNAFLFRINPRGTQFDGLIRNENRNISPEWDEQWKAAAVIGEDGWSAEIAIPFKILRFAAAGDQSWGINFERVIKRRNELAYWAGWNRNFAFHHVSQAGHLTGLKDLKQIERIRLRPYIAGGVEALNTVSPQRTRRIGEVGIDDLKLAVTSSLTADLAFNPDFAQTEVDAQRVNLTRFSLFFPEKRQFFIEGADSLRMGLGLLHFGPPPLELFYSRSVGLSEAGEPIPVIAGGKLTGKAARFDLGILNLRTGEHQNRPGENFAVVRMRREVSDRSYIGAIFTRRAGGGTSNHVVGADGRFVIRKYLNIAAMAARSFTPGVSEGQGMRQLGMEWRSDLLEAGANYMRVERNFQAGVGFVRRRDRMVGARGLLKPRPGGKRVRQFEIAPSIVFFHDDGGVLRTRQSGLNLAASFQSGDRIEFEVENNLERLSQRFPIGGGVNLAPGPYQWNSAGMTFRSFNGRKISGSAEVNKGGFYDGTKLTLGLSGDLRPNKNISFSPSYEFNDVSLRQGAFDTHLVGLRANLSFTRSLLTSAYVQYNTAGNLGAIQVRLNYIFRTIDNLYIVYNENRFTAGSFDGLANRSLVVKLTYSLHR